VSQPSPDNAPPRIHADCEAARANAAHVADFFSEVLSVRDAARASWFLAANFLDHDPADGTRSRRDGIAEKLTALWTAFPDGRFELEELVAGGDRVVARSRFVGTHLGPFGPLAPTRAEVDVSFMDLYRLEAGLIAEHWHNFDQFGLMQQLGAIAR
jgi:predicted ester cyclase